MKTFKGRGEHSVSQLEEIIEAQEEQLYQKQLINQDLLEALQELIPICEENDFESYSTGKRLMEQARKAISKALE